MVTYPNWKLNTNRTAETGSRKVRYSMERKDNDRFRTWDRRDKKPPPCHLCYLTSPYICPHARFG